MAERGDAPEKSANGSERTKTRDRERQSIWSVSSTWGTAFFAVFGVLTLATSCMIVAYLIANRGDAALMETYMLIAEKVFTNGAALGLTIYSITETMETAMVFANYLRQNLLEPLKERQREEGREETREKAREEAREKVREAREEGVARGREEGIEIGIKIGREEAREESTERGRKNGAARERENGTAREREERTSLTREEWLELGSLRNELKWRSWNERRERAAASGEPFDEPPPSFGG